MYKNILIIGSPASGKTTFANGIKGHFKVFHTDDYIDNADALMKDVVAYKGRKAVEGVGGYQLLLKGLKENTYHPDLVIELEVSDDDLQQAYMERGIEKLKHVKAMRKGQLTMLTTYFALAGDKKPEWVSMNLREVKFTP